MKLTFKVVWISFVKIYTIIQSLLSQNIMLILLKQSN